MPPYRWDPLKMNNEDWRLLRLELEQYFTPGTAIKEKDLILGRLEQIDKLVRASRIPGKHAVIFGERGTGKTSIGYTFRYFITGEEMSSI